jgi:hypothetical protein
MKLWAINLLSRTFIVSDALRRRGIWPFTFYFVFLAKCVFGNKDIMILRLLKRFLRNPRQYERDSSPHGLPVFNWIAKAFLSKTFL